MVAIVLLVAVVGVGALGVYALVNVHVTSLLDQRARRLVRAQHLVERSRLNAEHAARIARTAPKAEPAPTAVEGLTVVIARLENSAVFPRVSMPAEPAVHAPVAATVRTDLPARLPKGTVAPPVRMAHGSSRIPQAAPPIPRRPPPPIPPRRPTAPRLELKRADRAVR